MIGHCGVSDFSAYLLLGCLGISRRIEFAMFAVLCWMTTVSSQRGVGSVAVILEWCGNLGCYVSTAL
jgi:hypothetical protein